MDQISIINEEYMFISEHVLSPVVYCLWTSISWLGRGGVIHDQEKEKPHFCQQASFRVNTTHIIHNLDAPLW